jgi:transitional endoplasmic reticulum ATPase
VTDGFSGADLTSVVNTAMSLVLQEFIAAHPKPEDARKNSGMAVVTMKHFEDAIRKVKTSRDGKPPERVAVSYYR